MKLMGVEEDSAAWFCSYLSGRKQSCSVVKYQQLLIFHPVGSPKVALVVLFCGCSSHVISQMLFMSMRLIARCLTGVVEEVVDIIKDLMQRKVKIKLLVVSL